MTIIGFLEIDDSALDCDSPDFIEAMELESSSDWRRQHRVDRLKAVWMVLTTMSADCDWHQFKAMPYRVLAWKISAIIALLFDREGIYEEFRWPDRRAQWNTIDMGHWDFNKWYGGWNCAFLSFHPRQLRYEIIGDGESNL